MVVSSIIDFLKSDSSDSDEAQLSLDYIYGYQSDMKTVYYPIDGQQRLTTLFLVHVFVYSKCSRQDHSWKEFLDYPLLPFLFEERDGANLFIQSLMNDKLTVI